MMPQADRENKSADIWHLTARASPVPGADLSAFLEEQVYPNLSAEQLFDHAAHNFHKCDDKWRGGCPWHDSKSGSSFTVTPSKHLWWCAGCDAGGSPVEYLHRRNGGTGKPTGQDFVDVVRQLAVMAGVPFPERELTEKEKERARRRNLRRTLLAAVEERCRAVLFSPRGDEARAYLAERGFSEDDAQTLGLGLYPACAELRDFRRARGFDPADAEVAGVLFPPIEGYITFPWADDRGAPLTLYGSWPGREPPAGKPKKMALPNPKDDRGGVWENTKRSPLYLDRALKAGQTDLVVVEGLTDAALAQARGDTRVIACVAAQLSEEQVRTLKRRGVRSVTIALDPDKAGDNGIQSCVRQLRAAGIRAYVAPRLPDELDPDDFILRDGIDAWKAHLARRVNGYRYQARALIESQGAREPGDDAWADRVVDAAVAFVRGQPAGTEDELHRHFWPAIEEATGARAGDLAARVRVPDRNGEAPAASDPALPEPPEVSAADVATVEDLVRAGSQIRWDWDGWIQRGVVNALAATAGTGKTRFLADLIRRIRHGQPWPDGKPMTLPADTLFLWLVADNNHDELASLCQAFGIADVVRLNAPRSDPYSGVSLESAEDYAQLEARVKAVRPAWCIVDTVGNATSANLCRQEDAKGFYAPLQVLARKYDCAVIASTHLNASGQFLGRRILEKVRVALRMEQPDPDGDRRRLEVVKSNSRTPPALGVTMGEAGNEYDNAPPARASAAPGAGRPGPPPVKVQEAQEWLRKDLAAGPQQIRAVRNRAEQAGYSAPTLYKAADLLRVEEYKAENRKWWQLPSKNGAH
jgi:DNA primase catalytic core